MNPSLAFVFPGQGSQSLGMLAELGAAHPVVLDAFAEASDGCGVDLWACIQFQSFDSGARFECREKIAARVAPKDARNTCELFHPTVRVERETGSTAPTDARKAFDDLFKF